MTDTPNPENLSATPSPSIDFEDLVVLAREGHLPDAALPAALSRVGFWPSRNEWRWFVDVALLVLGALFLVAGIFFFFAYNWDALHRFAKLGLVQGGILGATALAFYLGLEKLSGRISLTAASLLVGALLGLAGQIYQSTADAYSLFLYWGLYIVPWAIIGRFTPLWLLVVGLFNLTAWFFWPQAGYATENQFGGESLFLINLAALVLWEWFHRKGDGTSTTDRHPTELLDWTRGRWWPRIVATVAFMAITFLAIGYVLNVFESDYFVNRWPVALVYPLFIVGMQIYYRHKIRDLFILTLIALSLIGVVTAGIARLVDFDDIIRNLVLTVAVLIQAGFAGMWLRHLGDEFTASEDAA